MVRCLSLTCLPPTHCEGKVVKRVRCGPTQRVAGSRVIQLTHCSYHQSCYSPLLWRARCRATRIRHSATMRRHISPLALHQGLLRHRASPPISIGTGAQWTSPQHPRSAQKWPSFSTSMRQCLNLRASAKVDSLEADGRSTERYYPSSVPFMLEHYDFVEWENGTTYEPVSGAGRVGGWLGWTGRGRCVSELSHLQLVATVSCD